MTLGIVSRDNQVQLYSSVTNEVRKSLSRFQEVAYSGHFRHDGQLLVAGSEGGVVKVMGESCLLSVDDVIRTRCLTVAAEPF